MRRKRGMRQAAAFRAASTVLVNPDTGRMPAIAGVGAPVVFPERLVLVRVTRQPGATAGSPLISR